MRLNGRLWQPPTWLKGEERRSLGQWPSKALRPRPRADFEEVLQLLLQLLGFLDLLALLPGPETSLEGDLDVLVRQETQRTQLLRDQVVRASVGPPQHGLRFLQVLQAFSEKLQVDLRLPQLQEEEGEDRVLWAVIIPRRVGRVGYFGSYNANEISSVCMSVFIYRLFISLLV